MSEFEYLIREKFIWVELRGRPWSLDFSLNFIPDEGRQFIILGSVSK